MAIFYSRMHVLPVECMDDEFIEVLNSLKNTTREADRELRLEAGFIAEEIVKPAVISAILSHAGNVGPKLAQSVRVRGDRIPSLLIGNNSMPRYSGKKSTGDMVFGPQKRERYKRSDQRATTNMLRYGTVVGPYFRASGTTRYARSDMEVSWPKNIVTPGWPAAADAKFYEPTFRAWEKAVDKIVYKFNIGRY